jgi:acylphosphatase
MVTSVAGAPLSGGIVAPPMGITTDQEALAKYMQAIDAQLKALENRGGNINLAKVAAAMADPGRTGSAAEGFGRAMGVIGQQRDEQEAQVLPIAQMRALLAGQQYQVAKQAKGLDIVGKIFNKSPGDAMGGMQPANGGIDLGLMPRLAQAHAALVNDPELRKFVTEQMVMQEKLIDTAIALQKQGMSIFEINDRIPGAAAYFKSIGGIGAPPSTGSGFGPPRPEPDVVPGINGRSTRAPDAAVGGTDDSTNTPPLGAPGPIVVSPNARAPAPAAAASNDTNSYTDPVTKITTDLSHMSDAEKRKFLVDAALREQERGSSNAAARGKEAAPAREAILSFRPGTTDTIHTDLDNLETIAARNPKVFDILRNNNDIRDIVNVAINEGIPLGNFGSIRLPVKEYILANMSSSERTDYQRARMILAQQFFASAMANKAAIPGTISNNEDKLLQAPLAGMDETVQAVRDYIKRTKVQNRHRAEIYKAFTEFEQKNKGAGLEAFFDPDNPQSRYHQVNSHFSNLYQTVTGAQ